MRSCASIAGQKYPRETVGYSTVRQRCGQSRQRTLPALAEHSGFFGELASDFSGALLKIGGIILVEVKQERPLADLLCPGKLEELSDQMQTHALASRADRSRRPHDVEVVDTQRA